MSNKEQIDNKTLDGWEKREPNVSYEIVNGKLIERPVPKVAKPKRER